MARRLGLPAVVGYLAVGLLVSPFTPGYVADADQLSLFADVGVVLLLFEVGIEVDLGRLAARAARAAVGRADPDGVTTAIAGGAFRRGRSRAAAAALLGLAIAMSSSVVIVNITRSRRRTTDRDRARRSLGWGVLQDVTGVAIAIVLLALCSAPGRPPVESLAGLAVFGALVVGRGQAPARWRSHRLRPEHDLFLLVSVSTGLAVAGAGAVLAGIPIALAAFIAGLAISDSPDAAEARRRLLPFRDVFAVFFFVAIGTLIDPRPLARRAALALPGRRARGRREVGRRLRCLVRFDRAVGQPAPGRRRAGPDRRVQLRAGLGRPRPRGASARTCSRRCWRPSRRRSPGRPSSSGSSAEHRSRRARSPRPEPGRSGSSVDQGRPGRER